MQAWQATVQDSRGNVIPNPNVSVFQADGTTLATVYDGAGVEIDNPIPGSIDGFVQFYAPAGKYKIKSAGGDEWTWVNDSSPPVVYEYQDLSDAISGNADGSIRINYDTGSVSDAFAGVLLEYTRRARFRTVGAQTISNNPVQRLFRGQMPSRIGGPRAAVIGVEMDALGSGVNGPGNADLAFEIHADKRDYLSSSAQRGEIDGAYIFLRQGNRDDAGGLLIDARKTRLGADDSGGLVGIECLSGINNGSGTLTQSMQTIIGFQEGAGGFTSAKGCGVAVEARVGNTHSGFAAISRTDIAGTTLDWSYYAGRTRSPADRIFGVNGATGAVHIGPPTTEVTLRHNATNLDVNRTDGTRVGRFRSSGVIEASTGIMASSTSSIISNVITNTSDLDYPSIAAGGNAYLPVTVTGAAVGDLAIISPTNNLGSGGFVFTARVVSPDTVGVTCINTTAAAIDPASQRVKIMVVRF